VWIQQRYGLTELPVLDVYLGTEKARGGDLDGGIRLIRKPLDDMWTRSQFVFYSRATSVLVETLLDRGADGDAAEAEAAIARLAAEPADGSVIGDVWLLRLRALLARAHGEDAAYRDYRDRYRAMAISASRGTWSGPRRCHDEGCVLLKLADDRFLIDCDTRRVAL
jgi:hypothetical protein